MTEQATERAWAPAELAPVGRHALGGRQIVASRRLAGGYRNDNTAVRTADGARFVLRRYPAAEAGAAGVCAVEAGIAVRLAGTAVPVPEVVYADPAGTLVGCPLLVSRFAAGTPGSRVLAGAGPADSERIGAAMGAALAPVGRVEFDRPGFFTGADLVPDGALVASGLAGFVDRELAAGNAAAVFGPAEQDALRALAAREASLVDLVSTEACLVHADFNPKNVLVEPVPGSAGWRVSAVLDWEFALAGSPLIDVGNVLRFSAQRPAGFEAGFVRGFTGAGGRLPDRWRQISRALDLFALVQFLSRPPDHRYFGKVARLLRDRLAGAGGPPAR